MLTAINPAGKGIHTRTFADDQVQEMSSWIDEYSGLWNLYFAINPPMRRLSKKADKSEIRALVALHVDIDIRAGEPRDEERERIHAKLTTALPDGVPPPTYVIDSGNGGWGIWKLAEPVVVDGDLERIRELERYNIALERAFGADHCHDITRICRLPYTVNIPNAKKRAKGYTAVPTSATASGDRAYSLEDFPMAEPGDDSHLAIPSAAVAPGEAAYTLENLRNAEPCAIATMEDVPEKARAIALHGVDAEVDHPPKDTSASGWFFSMLTTCTSAGVPPDVIAGICKSDDLHESLKYHIFRNKGDAYIAKQIEKALRKFPCVDGEGSEPFSEDHLATAFARAHENDLRYCAIVGKWFHWSGSRWEREETLLAWEKVKRVLRQAAAKIDDSPSFKRSLLSKNKTVAVETLARSDRRMAVRIEEFDADPMLLNTPDGVVDLRTGETMEHDPRRYMTKQTAVAPEAGEPERFVEFLTWATGGDAEFVAYLRRIMGYCLTGSTKEHALFFVHGAGGNGKSVLQEIMQWLLADYAVSTSFDTLAATQQAHHPTDLASMKGARLVMAPETEANQQWAEAKIKRMTGGDRIAARFMRQDFFEYTPQFKLFVVGNHRPGFANVDKAIRRRIHLLPFTQEVAPDKVDRDLAETLKREEGGKILAWAIAGASDWLARGLAAPAVIGGATDEYLESEDVVKLWLDECTENQGQTDFATLYQCYDIWCRNMNERPLTARKFGAQLKDRGWPSEHGTGGTKVRAMQLSPEGRSTITRATGSYANYPDAI